MKKKSIDFLVPSRDEPFEPTKQNSQNSKNNQTFAKKGRQLNIIHKLKAFFVLKVFLVSLQF